MSEATCGADSAPGWRFAYPGYRHASSPRVLSGSARRACPVRAKQNLRRPQTCEIGPRFEPAQGTPVVLFLFPVGACGTTGRKAAPAAPAWFGCGQPACRFRVAHGHWSSPTPKIVELNRASEADLRLRSARGWIFRLAACPRGCHWRRRAPVRASCRPDMHLGRPPVLPASAPSAARISDPHTCPGPGIVAATASRCHVSKTIATRPSPERDGGDDIYSHREGQEQKANIDQLFFLKTRNPECLVDFAASVKSGNPYEAPRPRSVRAT